MKEIECKNEALVLEALSKGCAPEHFEEPLRAHVETCVSCGELIYVYELFQKDSAQVRADTPVPEVGRVWWRAMVAARRAAAERALRPIMIAERIAWAVGGGAFIALLIFAAPRLADQRAWQSVFPGALVGPICVGYLIAIGITMGVLLVGGSLYILRMEK